jgi:hypothetical protein
LVIASDDLATEMLGPVHDERAQEFGRAFSEMRANFTVEACNVQRAPQIDEQT